ncbi:MAG: ParB/RepB/Spo0J family partition protein [Spirochaetales bacterium]|nr:ParB/RepB/Spo0J family partition protein [Spirochaetales bacterium]
MSTKKSALGKGLGALLQDEDFDVLNGGDTSASQGAGVREIALGEITANPHQPRKHFNEDSLRELADSIKTQGVISPLIVAPKAVGGYEIIAGERRFRASGIAGLEQVPVIVREDLSEENKLGIALIENIQREDLTAIEEAKAYREMMEALDLTQQEVAELVGKKRATVANSLRLLNLSVEMQDAVDAGDITAGHARSILSVVNPADQTLLFNRIKENGYSVREAERQAGELNKGLKSTGEKADGGSSSAGKDPHMLHIEQRFIDHFGTKVQLKGSLKKGKIEIDYYSSDDLDRILEVLKSEDEL